MNIRKVKRKCLVRGCNNIGSYNISRRREMGVGIMICRQCLSEALAAVIGSEQGETEAAVLGRILAAADKPDETPAPEPETPATETPAEQEEQAEEVKKTPSRSSRSRKKA